MESGVFAISPDALVRLVIFLLYVSVVLISYRCLIPRLSPTSKRLATVMLAAQVLVIVASLAHQNTAGRDRWLWHLDKEKNISTTLASTQLALVSAVALVTAWIARTQLSWHRLYFFGIGLVFLYLAREEFNEMRRKMFVGQWEIYYIVLGAVVVAATLVVASRSPRRAWIWHICLLAGLAVSTAGAFGVEELRYEGICRSLGLFSGRGCQSYHIEESLEFLGIWLTLIAVLGHFSIAVPRPRRHVHLLLYALLWLWIIWIMRNPIHNIIQEIELRLLYQPAAITYESDLELLAYRRDYSERILTVYLFTAADDWFVYAGLGFSVHLVDQVSGSSVAGIDDAAHRRYSVPSYESHGKYYRTYKQPMKIVIPKGAADNRALWVVLTTWREEDDEFVNQKIISSDHQLLGDTQVVLGELVLPAESATSLTGSLAEFDNGFALDTVDLPDRARSGETLTIPFTWRSKDDGAEDYIQFLHFSHDETDKWLVYDQQPLGARLPTRLWYAGLADSEIWQIPLPADLAPGRYKVFTGLYRASDQERLAASDADDTPFVDARVPLGILTIERT